jgi:hypothetical protein
VALKTVLGEAVRVQTGVGTVIAANEAPTCCTEFMVTGQVATPVQAPLHPEKVLPGAGVAVRVTELPLEKLALQVEPQLMPAGLLVTAPEPVGATVSA